MSEDQDSRTLPNPSFNDKPVRRPVTSDREYPMYGSSLEDYDADFRTVLGHRTISDLLRELECPTVIDALAPANMLRQLMGFKPKKDQLGIAISLEDLRTKQQTASDEEIGIKQIAGDITKIDTYMEILKTLDGRKADLIVERGWYGLDNIPLGLQLYNLGLKTAWNLLKPQGATLLGQLPPDNFLKDAGIDFKDWIKRVSSLGIHARYDSRSYGTFILTRKIDSPAQLPLIV